MPARRRSQPLWTFLAPTLFLGSVLQADLAAAWGDYGHRVIAAIADRSISSETREKIGSLLGEDQTLENTAGWAGAMERERRWTRKWHFVYVPRDRDDFIPERDCPQGGCLLSALENFATVLADKSSSKEECAEAVRFLVHLVGDLHEPLRCGFREDQGGRKVPVILARRKTTLFDAWETGFLARDQMDFEIYVRKLLKRASPADIEQWKGRTIYDWFQESRAVLRNHIYTFPETRVLDYGYQDHAVGVIDAQLLKAGIRLAALLDALLA